MIEKAGVEQQEQQQTWFIHKIKQEVNVTHNTHCYHLYVKLYICEISNFQSSQIYINIPSTHHIKRDRENETGQNKYSPLKKNIFTGFCVFLSNNEYILTASISKWEPETAHEIYMINWSSAWVTTLITQQTEVVAGWIIQVCANTIQRRKDAVSDLREAIVAKECKYSQCIPDGFMTKQLNTKQLYHSFKKLYSV